MIVIDMVYPDIRHYYDRNGKIYIMESKILFRVSGFLEQSSLDDLFGIGISTTSTARSLWSLVLLMIASLVFS